MKTQIDTVDAIPSKRIFLSIIADYDIKKAICELIDNAIDIWMNNGKKKPISIEVGIDLTKFKKRKHMSIVMSIV